MSANFLPYGRQHIDDEDVEAVVEALRGDYLTTGPTVAAFEDELCRATAAPHAIACANGTAALHLANLALDIAPGSYVAVPAVTFLASANGSRYVGAEVHFIDVDPDSGLITPQTLEDGLTTLPGPLAAVVAVSLAGQCPDLRGLRAICDRHGVPLIHDACHALGGEYVDAQGARTAVGAGVHETLATFSFHPVKTVAMGEGGAITTRDAALAARLHDLRSHGMTRDASRFTQHEEAFDEAGEANPWYYEMPDIGYNYRVPDVLCALGLSQLRRLDRFVARRTELVAEYDRLLADLAPAIEPVPRHGTGRTSWHLMTVLIDFERLGVSRAAVMNRLREQGIGTQVHYIPVPRQPYYAARYPQRPYPGASRYYARTLSLPLYVSMTVDDVARVVAALAATVTAAANS